MTQNRRKQVANLAPAQLNAAPIPADTYVRPAQPEDTRRAESFITALGAFNQNLSRFAEGQTQRDAEADRETAQLQANQINRSTANEREEIVRTGMIGGETIANAQVKKMAGAATGSDWARQMKAFLATRNLGEMDIEAFVHEQATEAMAGVHADAWMEGGFVEYIPNVVGWAEGQRDSQNLQAREKLTRNSTFAYLQSQITDRAEGGASPEDIAEWVQGFQHSIGTGTDRILTQEVMDGNVLRIAQGLVDEHPELATALVSMDREGVSGDPLAALGAIPNYAPQAANIVARGERVVAEREAAATITRNRQSNLQRVTSGDLRAFQGYTVNGKVVSKSQEEAYLLEDMSALLDQSITEGEITERQKRREIATIASRMNLDDPFIRDELDGIERRYNPADARNNPEVLADLEERSKLFFEYKGEFPNYVLDQISPATREFYEDFDAHKRFLGQSTEAAFLFASEGVNPSPAMQQNLNRNRDEINARVVQEVSGWFSSADLSHSGIYAGKVQQIASGLAARGMRVENAIDVAAERVFAEMPSFNDVPLAGLEGMNLPENYRDTLDRMVTDFREMDERGKRFEGDIAFRHLGGGLLYMMDREDGTALIDQHGANIIIDLQHLREQSDRLRMEAEDAAVERAVQNHERLQRVRRGARQAVDDPLGTLQEIDRSAAEFERGVVDTVSGVGRASGEFVRDALGINQRR